MGLSPQHFLALVLVIKLGGSATEDILMKAPSPTEQGVMAVHFVVVINY
jgi:hypothetical protein